VGRGKPRIGAMSTWRYRETRGRERRQPTNGGGLAAIDATWQAVSAVKHHTIYGLTERPLDGENNRVAGRQLHIWKFSASPTDHKRRQASSEEGPEVTLGAASAHAAAKRGHWTNRCRTSSRSMTGAEGAFRRRDAPQTLQVRARPCFAELEDP
jgi:hypothetical protein